MRFKNRKKHVSSFQIIILGFLAVILAGAFLLMLPVSSANGISTPFSDALFTSTSAVCVTGLVIHDTAVYWSSFGQTVLLLLIQIGGMGVVTAAVSLTIFSGRKISLMQRSTMQNAISAPHIGGIVRMTSFILTVTLLIELVGAALLTAAFCPEFGITTGLKYALFHSISAFCNAGFDLMGKNEEFSSLTSYADNPLINFTIMGLIITGGIGFITWDDFYRHKWHFKRYRMQSKVILVTTGFLILAPAIYFFFCEFTDMPVAERIYTSLFQSVAPRTAGFNTTDLALLTETGKMMIIILMVIGGSPGSTAGGIKTTTFAVLLSSALSVFHRRNQTRFFGRRVPEGTERNAATVLLMYLVLMIIGAMIISSVENLPILTTLFETCSAIGTVGLSLGITPNLGQLSRAILIILMFVGRVGGLTLVFAAFSKPAANTSKYPREKITVG